MDGTAGATRGRQLWDASPAWDRDGFVVDAEAHPGGSTCARLGTEVRTDRNRGLIAVVAALPAMLVRKRVGVWVEQWQERRSAALAAAPDRTGRRAIAVAPCRPTLSLTDVFCR